VTRLYDEPPIESETVEERRSLIEEMEIDDSLVMPRAGGRGVAGATNGLPSITARYWLLRVSSPSLSDWKPRLIGVKP
jgi:hypothetical protein